MAWVRPYEPMTRNLPECKTCSAVEHGMLVNFTPLCDIHAGSVAAGPGGRGGRGPPGPPPGSINADKWARGNAVPGGPTGRGPSLHKTRDRYEVRGCSLSHLLPAQEEGWR